MQVLIRLAELGSMRRAAQAVNMTQPAISQLLSELERLLETELFFRHARGVEPTDATKDLLPVAQRILAAIEDGSEVVANRLHQQGGVVRVAASPAALGGLLPGTLDRFAETNPDVQIHILEMAGNDPLGGIADASADIVCTREPPALPEGWSFDHCLNDALVAVCGHNHHLVDRDDIRSEDLGACKWLLNRVGSVARDRFEEISNNLGWSQTARCQIVMHIPELTREMLLTGKYLAILPRSVALPWLANGSVKELRTEVSMPLAPLGLLWRKQRAGAATTRFATHLKAATRSSSSDG